MVSRIAFATLFLLSIFFPGVSVVNAEEGAGVVSVKQMEHLHLGSWTLTAGGGIITQGKFEAFSSERPAGPYALIVTPPAGAETVITVTSGSDVKIINGRTASGVLPAGGTLTFSVDYDYTRLGDAVSVHSSPAGLPFELRTPWDVIKGKTPFTKKGLPEGSYSVQYILPRGCAAPPKLSKELLEGGRIAFEFSPVCVLLGTAVERTATQPASLMTMRSKLAQRLTARKTGAIPARLATTGRRVMSSDDPEHCHNQEAAKPLKRRD
jgi:hypothetical protein